MSEVTLKEYVERRLLDLESNISALADAKAEALAIQTKELERRLDSLNHAHALAVQNFNTYIPRNEYNITIGELHKWKNEIDAWRNRMLGMALGSAAGGGVAGALIAKAFGM